MTIAILEIAPHGHYTYVESMAKIYTALPENEVVIYTHEKGYVALQYLQNQQISIIVKKNTEGYDFFFQKIKKVDLVIVVTLEAYAKEPYHIMQQFEKTDFDCPIYYVIHNVDFWFKQSLYDKFVNVFYKLKTIDELRYKVKVYFYYTFMHKKIIRKIKNMNGKFVTLTKTVGNELSKHVGSENVSIMPFSVFENTILDKSIDNQRIRICIPGYVSIIRRDYHAIFSLFENDHEGTLKETTEWDFLGGIPTASIDGGISIRDKALAWIEKGYHIHIYDKPSVGIEEFDTQLAKADIVLGNMFLVQGKNHQYGKSKETGLIFTMIKAAKPGILPSTYPCEDTMHSSILLFDNYDQLPNILTRLVQFPNELSQLKKNALQNSLKYTPLNVYWRLIS
jgi:hypothetical protein